MTSESAIKTWSDTVLVGAITLVGYLCAFFYEFGFLNFYGLPLSLIEVDLTNIFISTSAVIFTAFIILSLVDLLSPIVLTRGNSAIRRTMQLGLFFFLPFWAGMFFIYGTAWEEWLPWIAPIGAIFLADVTAPFLLHKDKKTVEEKFAAAEAQEQMTREGSIIAKLIKNVDLITIRIVTLIVFFLILAYNSGRADALQQKDFWTIGPGTSKVILKIYYDHLIIAEVDGSRFTNRIYLANRDEITGKIYLQKDIGPFVVNK